MANEKEPSREWRDVVIDIRKEEDPERLSKLVRELDEALIAEEKNGRKTLRINGFIRGRKPSK